MQKIHHITSAQNIASRELLEKLFQTAETLQNKQARNDSLQGKILACLLYEPSTRTRFSFEAAMLRLGGQVLSSEDAGRYSSAKKGETLEDAIQIINGYADCIMLRHPEKGAAQRAAEVSDVPLINGGDGPGEHPTQALLDVYTLYKELGKIDGLNIAIVGDLKHGRTVHSLLMLLDVYKDMRLRLVSPKQLTLPAEYKQNLQNSIEETTNMQDMLSTADVVYMTRIQKERFEAKEEYENLKDSYIFGKEELALLKKNAVIMHPLPRVDEISKEVDKDPRSAYFRQAHNGLYVRMALLQHLLE
jgi:aspartate carbamoyltransferase catalytic subunit